MTIDRPDDLTEPEGFEPDETPRLPRPAVRVEEWGRGRRWEILVTIAATLIILWLLGGVSSYTMGGFIDLLLVIAIVAVLIRIIQGRRPV